MRIYLSTTKNRTVVPYDHIPFLVGAIHKWLGGINALHDEISLYSFSWLRGAKAGTGGLHFPYGAEWFISSYDTTMIKSLVTGIQSDPTINFGLIVKDMVIKEDRTFGEVESFSVASPIFIKRRVNEILKHFIYDDEDSDKYLTETLQTKLKKAGLVSDNIEVSFNKEYHRPQTKLVNYNGISNRASICPIIIKGSPQQISFAWNVGVGNSTGIGFGALD